MNDLNSLLLLLSSVQSIQYPDVQYQSSYTILYQILGLVQFLMLSAGVLMFFPSLIIVICKSIKGKKEGKPVKGAKGARICLVISILCLVIAPFFGIFRSFTR